MVNRGLRLPASTMNEDDRRMWPGSARQPQIAELQWARVVLDLVIRRRPRQRWHIGYAKQSLRYGMSGQQDHCG
jgi:hypothetical protein